jgi:hypothetical protein
MLASAGLFTLILALDGTNNFKPTKLVCKDTLYTFSKDGIEGISIHNNGRDYNTKFKTDEELSLELDKQCGIVK